MSKDKLDKKLENNRLILEFMGYTKDVYDHGRNGTIDIWKNDSIRKGHYRTLLECNFHYDWNELMPVWSKINRLYKCIEIKEDYVKIDVRHRNSLSRTSKYNKYGEIGALYRTIIEFIKWYNQNKLNETN